MEYLTGLPLWSQITILAVTGSIVINFALLLPLRLRVNRHQEKMEIVVEVAARSILWPITWGYTIYDDIFVYGQLRDYIRHFFGAVFGREESVRWFYGR